MARCILAQGTPPEYTPENLASTNLMLDSIRLSIRELQSLVDQAENTMRQMQHFDAKLIALAENGEHLSPDDLKALEEITDHWVGELGDKEWPIGYTNSCCEFLLGKKFEMENGDIYRDRVLTETYEQRRAATQDVNAARLAAFEQRVHEISWTTEPRTEQEKKERAQFLDAVERRATIDDFPGEVFSAFGICDQNGRPLVSIRDASHLSADVREAFARASDAKKRRERGWQEARLRGHVVSIAQYLSMHGVG